MLMQQFRRLAEHMAWADARVLDSLRASGGVDAERALELFAHVVGAEHVWMSRIEQVPRTVAVWPALTLDEAAALAAENADRLRALLARLTDAELATELPYTNSAGQSFRSTIGEMLTQVMMHGSYHRGQIAWLVRHGGGEPSPTDFIAFARGVPAATRGPAPR